MMFGQSRPHVFREVRVHPAEAMEILEMERGAVAARALRADALRAYAVHLSFDRARVITLEAWASEGAFRRDADSARPGVASYCWAGTGGREPTPVDDASAGVIVIDIFSVPQLLSRPISAFNLRNGEAFNREPGCISTTVLRGIGVGRIATYARWRSVDAFAAAFAKITGRPVADTDDINKAAATMTFGLIRPDYHAYELIAFLEKDQ